MGLKKYIAGSLLLAICVFGYAFSIKAGDYTVQIAEFSLTLPIAVWIILPMVTLLLLTIIHILYYGLKHYFTIKAITKDSESVVSLINKRILNESSEIKFQNENFKEIGSVIEQLEIDVKDNTFRTENKELSKAVENKFNINSGKYIPTKELKLENENPLMVQNTQNRISEDDKYALEIVQSPDKYSQTILKSAFLKVLKSKSMTSVKKVLPELILDNDMIKALLKKDSEQNPEFAMTNDLVLSTLKKADLSNDEIIEIAKDYKTLKTPDQIIQLIEDLSQEKEKYTTAYLYILAEYEMIDKMKDILVNSATNEFIPFKALIDLKDAGKHTYSLDTISYK